MTVKIYFTAFGIAIGLLIAPVAKPIYTDSCGTDQECYEDCRVKGGTHEECEI